MMTMKNASITSSRITSKQKDQIVRFAEDAARKAIRVIGLDNPGAQQVIGNGDKLANAIIDKIRELSLRNQFANEETSSSYTYPSEYKPKSVTEQANKLSELFPGIGNADETLADKPLPKGAGGYFVIPRWEKVAPTYNEAVHKVLSLIASSRKFYNYREGQLGPDRLRQHERTVKMLAKLGKDQKGELLVIPAQFGMLHRGQSVRRAREVFMTNEFGLGAFVLGCMILTHPERLVRYEELDMDCPGDEFSPEADGGFSGAPGFNFRGGRVRFGARWVSDANDFYGSASGFVPQ